MKLRTLTITALLVSMLVSCGSPSTPIPAQFPIASQSQISTSDQTATRPTSTLTSILPTTPAPSPTIEAKVNDLPETVAAVDAFTKAMQAAGLQLNPEEVRQGLAVKSLQGRDGHRYEIAFTSDGYPLMLKEDTGSWTRATTKNLADLAGFDWGTSTTISYEQSWSEESKVMIPITTLHNNRFVLDYDLMWYNYSYPENSLRPSATEFNFNQVDSAVGYAKQNNLSLQGQHLLVPTPKFLPTWLLEETDPSRIREYALNHITTLVSRYPQIKNWCVAVEFDNPYTPNFWQKTYGLEDLTWLKEFFETAHTANPEARLYYSDFDIEFGGAKADKVFQMISTLQQLGTPIDEIAFQMHLNGIDFATEELRMQKIEALKTQIARYTAIGVEVILPEYDLNMHGVPGDDASRAVLQAQIEYELMVALFESGVTNISHFGGDDKLNWKQDSVNGGGPDALATNFDMNGNPKANYYADMQAMTDFLLSRMQK